MSVLQFYPLSVKEVRSETHDCVSVLLDVPENLQEIFRFAPGQYLTLRRHIHGAEVRRSYSICVGTEDGELRVAIKKVEDGKFSSYANTELQKDDLLDVMPPMGKFSPKPSAKAARNYLAFAAGSGITPIMSIVKTVLQTEPDSTFTLVYGNKNRNTIIFREALEGLKNKYMQQFSLYHVLSREMMDVPLFNGRIDAEKSAAFFDTLLDAAHIDEVFICGPEEMILTVKGQMLQLGFLPEQIHIELFTSPDEPKPEHDQWMATHQAAHEGMSSQVSITLDGTTFEINLPYNGDPILDAALKRGADLPYACKSGVCCTCRAKIIEGAVDMEVNYALEKDEIEKGFVLTCQSHPRTPRVVVDFDAR
jgi:ring-1,2-phenylacetyl-CoA epoxidase subunit PaaE